MCLSNMQQEEGVYDEITCLRIGVAHFSCNLKASEYVRHGTGLSSAYCKKDRPMKRKDKQRRQRVHPPKPMHKTMKQRHEWKGNYIIITLHNIVLYVRLVSMSYHLKHVFAFIHFNFLKLLQVSLCRWQCSV